MAPVDDDDQITARYSVGALAIGLAVAIVAVALIDGTVGFPFNLPRTWYIHRPLWIFFAVSLLVAGFVLQGNRRPDPRSWRPVSPGVRFHQVVLYTREGCHLCDDVRELLGKYADDLPEIEDVDIDSDPELQERFGLRIPVVEIDGQIRFSGRVDEVLLRRLIDGTPLVT